MTMLYQEPFDLTQDIITLFKKSPRPKFMAEIAEELGLDKNTLRYHIYALEKAGILEKKGGNQQRPLYILNEQIQYN
jgi:predicted transcriptional regulator